MKFTEGVYFMKKGFRAIGPAHAYDVVRRERKIEVLVYCHAIEDRGGTLGGPLFTVRLSSPVENATRRLFIPFLRNSRLSAS